MTRRPLNAAKAELFEVDPLWNGTGARSWPDQQLVHLRSTHCALSRTACLSTIGDMTGNQCAHISGSTMPGKSPSPGSRRSNKLLRLFALSCKRLAGTCDGASSRRSLREYGYR